jgi:hypothetical protein
MQARFPAESSLLEQPEINSAAAAATAAAITRRRFAICIYLSKGVLALGQNYFGQT